MIVILSFATSIFFSSFNVLKSYARKSTTISGTEVNFPSSFLFQSACQDFFDEIHEKNALSHAHFQRRIFLSIGKVQKIRFSNASKIAIVYLFLEKGDFNGKCITFLL